MFSSSSTLVLKNARSGPERDRMSVMGAKVDRLLAELLSLAAAYDDSICIHPNGCVLLLNETKVNCTQRNLKVATHQLAVGRRFILVGHEWDDTGSIADSFGHGIVDVGLHATVCG